MNVIAVINWYQMYADNGSNNCQSTTQEVKLNKHLILKKMIKNTFPTRCYLYWEIIFKNLTRLVFWRFYRDQSRFINFLKK